MERDRLGSAIVTQDGKPIGIFTTTDALRVLRGMLLGKEVEPLVDPEVARGEGDPDKHHVRTHLKAKGPSRYDGMVSWFLTRF